jgi:hypothetical protein
VKQFDVLHGRYIITYRGEAGIRQRLRMICLQKIVQLTNKGRRSLNGWEVFMEFNSDFHIKKGFRFYSKNEHIFSLWQGWKYTKLEAIKLDKIKTWLEMVYSVISG